MATEETERSEKDHGIERLGTATMNILYKYCDQVGIEKILETLELKLPRISEVNDPLECLPFFYCPNDKTALKEQCLRTFSRNRISPPVDWKQALNRQFEKGEIQKKLEKGARERLRTHNQKSCLLSVSKAAQNTVMWAHYAENHKGGVIGLDFDNISPNTNGIPEILMNRVSYSKDRPRMNVLAGDMHEEILRKTALTKSINWNYEKEFRALFSVDTLNIRQQQGLACQKDFNGKDTWFLRLNPISIKEVIFGLETDESLKSAIRKLIEQPNLQHVKLYEAEESETYTLNLKSLKKSSAPDGNQ